eukprot:GHVO01011490.1.p1 GENE.GHVO01011490.1~~GHVO01011490.1.p1  ORF type:complete len:617 (-),score=133.72 GHVO01011490.1:205-1797(-)
MESFNMFMMLMTEYELDAMFIETLPLLRRYLNAFDAMGRLHFPKVTQHFESEHIDTPMFIYPWFLCLFVTSVPIRTATVLWDFIITDGLPASLLLSVAIMKILADTLLSLKCEKILNFLKSMRVSTGDNDTKVGKQLVKYAQRLMPLPPEIEIPLLTFEAPEEAAVVEERTPMIDSPKTGGALHCRSLSAVAKGTSELSPSPDSFISRVEERVVRRSWSNACEIPTEGGDYILLGNDDIGVPSMSPTISSSLQSLLTGDDGKTPDNTTRDNRSPTEGTLRIQAVPTLAHPLAPPLLSPPPPNTGMDLPPPPRRFSMEIGSVIAAPNAEGMFWPAVIVDMSSSRTGGKIIPIMSVAFLGRTDHAKVPLCDLRPSKWAANTPAAPLTASLLGGGMDLRDAHKCGCVQNVRLRTVNEGSSDDDIDMNTTARPKPPLLKRAISDGSSNNLVPRAGLRRCRIWAPTPPTAGGVSPIEFSGNDYNVGRRVSVMWLGGGWHSAVIDGYDKSTGKHNLIYDDGVRSSVVLSKCTYTFL